MDMKMENDLMSRLSQIETLINAKGHPMQDFSTLKTALLDLIEVLRMILNNREVKSA